MNTYFTRIKQLKLTFTLVFLAILLFISLPVRSTADLGYYGETYVYDKEYGFLSSNSTYLQMVNADVLFELNFPSSCNFEVIFNGTYTISNPNETVNGYVAAPFDIGVEIDILTLEINGTPADFELIECTLDEIDSTYSYTGLCAVSNVTFESNTTTVFHYSFMSKVKLRHERLIISYTLGTSRTWNGPVNERVEVRSYGEQPRDWYPWTTDRDVIPGGYSYAWVWENETIEDDEIRLRYYGVCDLAILYRNWLPMTAICIFSLLAGSHRYFKSK